MRTITLSLSESEAIALETVLRGAFDDNARSVHKRIVSIVESLNGYVVGIIEATDFEESDGSHDKISEVKVKRGK